MQKIQHMNINCVVQPYGRWELIHVNLLHEYESNVHFDISSCFHPSHDTPSWALQLQARVVVALSLSGALSWNIKGHGGKS